MEKNLCLLLSQSKQNRKKGNRLIINIDGSQHPSSCMDLRHCGPSYKEKCKGGCSYDLSECMCVGGEQKKGKYTLLNRRLAVDSH